jgi:tetratricopeptide (TPR) repeat protein
VALAEEEAAAGRSRGQYDAGVWYEYGAFHLRRGHWARALICLREAVSVSAHDLPPLLSLAALQASRGAHEEAVVFAQAAARVATGADATVVSQALLSLCLQLHGKQQESGRALRAAVKALAASPASGTASGEEAQAAASAGAAYLRLARFLLDVRLDALARKALEAAADALADTPAPRGQRVELLVLRCRQFLQAAHGDVPQELREPSAATGGVSASGTVTPSGSRPGTAGAGGPVAAAALTAVPVGASGKAYDGAIISAAECAAGLARACDMEPTAWEAWHLRALLALSGLAADGAPALVTGASELADVPPPALQEARRCLELTAAHFTASGAGAGAADLLASDASFLLARVYMALGHVNLRLASLEHAAAGPLTPGGGAPTAHPDIAAEAPGDAALQAAKEAYMRAATAAAQGGVARPTSGAPRARGSAGPEPALPGPFAPWASAWLGVGRAAWAQGHAAEAEAVLSEANALDNQHPVIWAWLAYVCGSAGSDGVSTDASSIAPARDREACFALEQALRSGVAGNCADTTALLVALADRHRAAGQVGLAASLLRRATVQSAAPLGVAHLAAALRARLGLAATLSEGPAVEEEALVQYAAVLEHGNKWLPRAGADGGGGADMEPVQAARTAAAEAAATLLMKQGRAVEAGRLLAEHGFHFDSEAASEAEGAVAAHE